MEWKTDEIGVLTDFIQKDVCLQSFGDGLL